MAPLPPAEQQRKPNWHTTGPSLANRLSESDQPCKVFHAAEVEIQAIALTPPPDENMKLAAR